MAAVSDRHRWFRCRYNKTQCSKAPSDSHINQQPKAKANVKSSSHDTRVRPRVLPNVSFKRVLSLWLFSCLPLHIMRLRGLVVASSSLQSVPSLSRAAGHLSLCLVAPRVSHPLLLDVIMSVWVSTPHLRWVPPALTVPLFLSFLPLAKWKIKNTKRTTEKKHRIPDT